MSPSAETSRVKKESFNSSGQLVLASVGGGRGGITRGNLVAGSASEVTEGQHSNEAKGVIKEEEKEQRRML